MTQEFVTLPRAVVEQAITAIETTSLPLNYDNHYEIINSLRSALEQPQVEQEPFVWLDTNFGDVWEKDAIALYGKPAGAIPLYTHTQPKREPLTDDLLHSLWLYSPVDHYTDNEVLFKAAARSIEAAHDIK